MTLKLANAEEVIVKSLRSQLSPLMRDGVLDCWYDMDNRAAKINAGDWVEKEALDAVKSVLREWVDEDKLEVMDEAGGPGSGDWIKVASCLVDIRKSQIHGKGLFTTRRVNAGDVLCDEYMRKTKSDDSKDIWDQCDYCRYTNHSAKANACVRVNDDVVSLVAEQELAPGVEITVDYRDVSSTLGKNFSYTYKGKPYGNVETVSYIKRSAACAGLIRKQAATTDDVHDRLLAARQKTDSPKSPAVAAAGNYRKGKLEYHGLRLSIENPKGSTRSGVNKNGTKWSREMTFDYGYIRGTTGADGDPVDVFLGDDLKSEIVFIINQVDKAGRFDEHKVILGVPDTRTARAVYLSNYPTGWTGCGSIVSMTMPQFKNWLTKDKSAPAENVKTAYVWPTASRLVELWYKTAKDVANSIHAAIKDLPVADPGYGHVYWHPERHHVWIVLSDGDEQDVYEKWHTALEKVPGVNKIFAESEVGPRDEGWVQIKRGGIKQAAGLPGSPSAAAATVLGSLIGGGAGYAGGSLLGVLAPERYVDREKLKRNMAIAGAAIGGLPGLGMGVNNMHMNARAGDPSIIRSFFSPAAAQKVHPDAANYRRHVMGKSAVATYDSGFSLHNDAVINVDRFNNVIWQDPNNPPAVTAMASGLVSGISQQYNSKLLTPRHFIRGLAAAGVDSATATVAGGVLGALGVIKPEAQRELQQLGLWSGLIRGTVSSVLGQ